jgi:hypothetical protein
MISLTVAGTKKVHQLLKADAQHQISAAGFHFAAEKARNVETNRRVNGLELVEVQRTEEMSTEDKRVSAVRLYWSLSIIHVVYNKVFIKIHLQPANTAVSDVTHEQDGDGCSRYLSSINLYISVIIIFAR